ncbi:unnamed protein product [Staurois parvus]|uniref:Uncharacterized protein n=1 Tax=Staurois parvus TaxID=386267 RepID=A0ABN9FVG0_9NEOB|nr:unnamed protein product [Staurois parvus]
MDPVMGTHQRDVPVLCIPGIPHRKVTPSLTIIRVETFRIIILLSKKEYKEEDEEYGVMEEFSEGHKDMMEPPNTRNPPERCPDRPLYSRDSTQEGHTIPHHHQVDGSSHGNPPERCPRPLYSRDSTQEGHTIPPHHQSGILGDDNIDVKEEYKEEDEEYGVMEEFSEGHKDMMEPPNTRNPPERCPRPLYSRDSTQEGHTIPPHHQVDDDNY